jgi:hypothetical protein
MDSGYGDEESYNVYDKPWRESGSLGAHIYRPSRNLDKDVYGDDLDKLIRTNRYYFCGLIMNKLLGTNVLENLTVAQLVKKILAFFWNLKACYYVTVTKHDNQSVA